MEAHPEEAVKNIVHATRQLADLAQDCGVETFVLTSTDKVVNPTSVMAACKRVTELYLQALAGGRFVIVRFGNVLDSAGSVVQIFRQQIANGGPVTVTHPEMERFFMTIPEAARLVIQASAIGRNGDILILDMGEPIKIVALASDMIRLSGFEENRDIKIKYIGLRPGERLREELRNGDESHLITSHPKVRVVQHQQNHSDSMRTFELIEHLIQVADNHPQMIKMSLSEIVPEYRPHCDVSSLDESHGGKLK